MTTFVHGSGLAAGGDPHQGRVDALRGAGPAGLSRLLGDEAAVLQDLAATGGSVFDARGHDSREFSELIGRVHEVRSVLEALEARAIVAIGESTQREHHAALVEAAGQEADVVDGVRAGREASRIAAREVSMVTRRAPADAGQTLTSCRRLVASMPGLLSALAGGRVTADAAHAAAKATGPLTPTQREQVDAILTSRLPDLDAAGPGRFRDAVAMIIHELDPTGHDARHQQARADRQVRVRAGQHGMATVSAHLPALDAQAIGKRLRLEGERLRAGGDRRGHQVIMADAFTDTLLGRQDGMDPVQLDVGIMITDRSLYAPTRGDIAHIEGYGPVPAAAVRAELDRALREPAPGEADPYGPDGPALRAEFRRLFTHPVTGELVAVESTSRAFSAAMGRFLRLRDTTCRGPFCDAPARHHDHITPHAAGGPTSIDNGQGTCALCNQKERHLHHVTRETGDPDDPGAVTGTGETGASGDTGPGRSGRPGHRVTWTSRNGTTRTTTPTRLTPPATTPAQATAPRERSGAPRPPAQPEPGRPEPGRPEPGRPARPTTPVAPKAPPRGTALPEHLPPGVHRGTSHRDTRPRRSPGIRHRRGSSSDGDEDDSTDP